MCLTKGLTSVMNYISGTTLYMSDIEPFSFSTRDIESQNISVIISLMEEYKKPQFLRESIDPKIYPWISHYYFNIKNEFDFPIEKYFKDIYQILIRFIQRGVNILIHCRTGLSITPTILIAFFIRSVFYSPEYIIHNYIYFIPKTKNNWTESFLDFLKTKNPEIQLSYNFLQKLYIYENSFLE